MPRNLSALSDLFYRQLAATPRFHLHGRRVKLVGKSHGSKNRFWLELQQGASHPMLSEYRQVVIYLGQGHSPHRDFSARAGNAITPVST